ncbi:MAG: hypothetical protein ACOCUY_02825 [Verrucomicrobiota bacterium]
MNLNANHTKLFLRWRSRLRCCLLALVLPALVFAASESSTLDEQAYRRYQDLRRQFYVAVSLAPARTGIRAEHQAYYRNATKLLDAIPKSRPHARASVIYRRGRVVLHCNRYERARADFEAAIELLEQPQPDIPDADRLGGIPTLDEVKLFHALTFEGEGVAVLLDKFEELPENAVAEHESDMRDKLTDLALELDRQERYKLEIRVYKLIKKFGLSTGDADDPDKHIAILRAKLGDDAPPNDEPETDNNQPEEQ